MANTNNPAGRLFNLLTEYQTIRIEMEGHAPSSIWERVLGNDFVCRLPSAAILIPQTREALQQADDEAQSAIFEHHVDSWAAPLYMSPVAFNQGVTGAQARLGDESLLALNGLASFLAIAAPDGTDVSEEDQEEIFSILNQLVETVRSSTDLDPSFRLLVLKRLHDLSTALDEYRLGGPAGLLAAADRLLAAIIPPSVEPETHNRLQPLFDIVVKVYRSAAFVGSTAPTMIENYEKIALAIDHIHK